MSQVGTTMALRSVVRIEGLPHEKVSTPVGAQMSHLETWMGRYPHYDPQGHSTHRAQGVDWRENFVRRRVNESGNGKVHIYEMYQSTRRQWYEVYC